MTKQGSGAKRGPAAPNRPLWRRLNRHVLFGLHVLLFVVVGTWIWTLNAPTQDKQFDVLLWLTALSGHGLFVYRNRWAAFAFHLLMFSAGNGTIWVTTAPVADKLSVTLAWIFVVGGIGLWLARRQFNARPSSPPAKKTRTRKPAAPTPEPEAWYEPPADDDSSVMVADDDTPVKKPRRKGRA